jgi:N-acetyltransferase
MDFDRQPTLTGPRFVLRPLVAADSNAMTAAASDPFIWELHPASDRYREEVFRAYFTDRLASGGTLVVEDRLTAVGDRPQLVGWSSYGEVDEARDEVEIGWTFLVRELWGGSANREIKALMLEHAFRSVTTVSLRIGENNLRSQRATEKIGAVRIDRPHSAEFGGVVVPHVVYTITAAQFKGPLTGS